MTKRELTQLYYLKQELKQEVVRLAKLELSAAPTEEMDETRRVIKLKKEQAEIQYQRTVREIMGIDDALLRQIFLMRHIDLLSWTAIAMRIGGGNTPDGVRKAHDRYIRTHVKSDVPQ